MNRRQLIQSLLGTVASYSLLKTLFSRDAFGAAVKPVTDSWVRELNEISRDLKAGRIAPGLGVEEALRKYGHDTHHA